MKPIFLTIFALCSLLPLRAQNTTRADSLMNREMMLEREYNPTTRDAVKLGQLPELREPQAPKSSVEFSNYASPFNVQSRLIALAPQSYLTRLNYSKYKGYLTGGISSLLDINGDLGYQILNSDKDRLNLFFSHRSSRSNISYLQDVTDSEGDEKQPFKINDNWGGLNYQHDFGEIKFTADAKYTNSAFNYYGLSIPDYRCYFSSSSNYLEFEPMPNNNFDKKTNQINNMFEAHIGVSSEKDSEFNYKINAGYTNFRQKYGNTINKSGSRENRFLIDGDISQPVNSTVRLGLSGAIKTYSYSDETFRFMNNSMTNYWTYSLNPYLYWENNNVNLTLGAKFTGEVEGRKKIIVSPTVRFNYYPSNRSMFYILADGGRKDNSQYNLFYENRYVDPLIRIMDSRSPLDATAGIKFMPLSTLSVDIFGGYKITQDEHFFYPRTGAKNFDPSTPMLAGNWITPVYDDANTLKFGADLKYAFQDILELNLKGTYYKWMMSDVDDMLHNNAWNKPDFEINLNTACRLPMLPLRFDLSYLGAYGRVAGYQWLYDSVKMKDIHDLSIKGTYSITPNFSAYLSFNNLLFSKYDFWWGYPAQGFNIMGGLSILF